MLAVNRDDKPEIKDITVEELLGETSDDSYANDDVGNLVRWLVNERMAPEILPYQSEIVENLIEMMDAQQENIDLAAPDSSTSVLLVTLYNQEMERLRYLIRNYLRTRLAKIHKYTLNILNNDNFRQRLSVHELDFAEKFQSLLEKNFKATCLDDLPPFLGRLDENTGLIDMVSRPDLDNAVICRVNTNVGPVLLKDSGETINMMKNNIYILRYNSIKELLISGSISLL